MSLIEVNFDGLVGPTHHYGGLGLGNLASREHAGQTSHPRAAALQGLDKIERLAAEGAPQAVLPPHFRPDFAWLRELGFEGDDAERLRQAADVSPRLLSAAWSASAMWVANAATVSPAADCSDGRTHLTVANLLSSPHRSIEPAATEQTLREIFRDPRRFAIHSPLPGGVALRDEGAANHLRFFAPAAAVGGEFSGPEGIEVFVHGGSDTVPTRRFLPRQTEEASLAVARLHGLRPERTFFLAQHPAAIDAGAFHNDVVATSCGDVLLYHQLAFAEAEETLAEIAAAYRELVGVDLLRIEISETALPLEDAVASYLFNSQLIERLDGQMTIVVPSQVREVASANACLEDLLAADNPIDRAVVVELRESMWNGGGPACLRLRVPLSQEDLARVHPGVLWSARLGERLRECVTAHYREQLTAADLRDPAFAREAHAATAAVRKILGLWTEAPP
ncbi:N-succinylarginine dihydrolase [Candidatus Laterigemmans baculatus]|uniref:N-succinylarginine dihydrolase n=1 Tax=Candidatus Laterigemmans baculatus TaxID=2770505 RepID=UPI0013DD24AD|nr:N-succinylarginine dihydrolase [Candidatus Laterigemmans baculatus]